MKTTTITTRSNNSIFIMDIYLNKIHYKILLMMYYKINNNNNYHQIMIQVFLGKKYNSKNLLTKNLLKLEMMDRLDSLAPVIQIGNPNNEWSLPCEPEAIPQLQNWLEQLSANIQIENSSNDNIYPDILIQKQQQQLQQEQQAQAAANNVMLTPPHQQLTQQQQDHLLSTEDYDLYPKLDDNNVWTSSIKPQSASESSFIHTPPSYEQHYSSPTASSSSYNNYQQEVKKNVKPQFWSPGYITSPPIMTSPPLQHQHQLFHNSISTQGSSSSAVAVIPPPLPPRPAHHFTTIKQEEVQQAIQLHQQEEEDVNKIDYYTPSDAIDFNVTKQFDPVQPNFVFETSKKEDEGSVTPVLSNQPSTFDEKKELMHMMNVFSAPRVTPTYKPKEVVVDETVSLNKEEEESDEEGVVEYQYQDYYDNETDSEEEDYETEGELEEEEDVKSPYADLVGMIQDMNVKDDLDTAKKEDVAIKKEQEEKEKEEEKRKRHALLVSTFAKKVASLKQQQQQAS